MPKDRNGIEVFENRKDIYDIFMEKASATEALLEERKENPEPKSVKVKVDKHGMPFLNGTGSLSKIFSDGAESEKYLSIKHCNSQEIYTDLAQDTSLSGENAEQDENFLELIENALKGKDRDSMMRAKSDRPLPEAVPLKKRLKRYPPPEDEIDLHGYNAKEAESKTEIYLRNCWRNGLFTVQIIVGRGIHSPYGAVLPDVVEDLMTRLKREGVLLWFEWDRRTKSQSGAVIAYLKQF
ncbi:MAG: Smr/MutS family protein [Desulfamplus sp.]|nr:Smr/MutS family protein [Desulfamplus sp.]